MATFLYRTAAKILSQNWGTDFSQSSNYKIFSSEITGSICVFEQYQLTSQVKFTRNGQTLSLSVSQTGQHELIISGTKLSIELIKAIGETQIETVEKILAKA